MNYGYQKGRGAQINPKNKFSSYEFVKDHIESIDEDSTINHQRKVYLESPKNIISENKSQDIPFRYSINPYQGCEHGCVYCYARNVHPYWGFSAGMDWETKIIAKVNAPQLLEKAFLKKSWKPVRTGELAASWMSKVSPPCWFEAAVARSARTSNRSHTAVSSTFRSSWFR